MPEVQSLVSDPRVYSIDGSMCRWSLKPRESKDKAEFMRKQTRWLTSSRKLLKILVEIVDGKVTGELFT